LVDIVYHCDTAAQYKAKPFLQSANSKVSKLEESNKRRAIAPLQPKLSLHAILGAARVEHFREKFIDSDSFFSLQLSSDGHLACDFDGFRGTVVGLERKLLTPVGQVLKPLCFKPVEIMDDEGASSVNIKTEDSTRVVMSKTMGFEG
jgi:hypothetical protein